MERDQQLWIRQQMHLHISPPDWEQSLSLLPTDSSYLLSYQCPKVETMMLTMNREDFPK